MKNKFLLFFLFTNALLCFAASCKKTPDAPQAEIDKLPPATQTGANTMGALVNGRAFVADDYQCNYIFTNGGYYFLAAGSKDDSNSDHIIDLTLSTDLLQIQEGQTLKLENRNETGKACGLYSFIYSTTPTTTYETRALLTGQLTISRFDQVNQIVSGTFSFNAINLSKGDTVHVTDGRFDMKYTL